MLLRNPVLKDGASGDVTDVGDNPGADVDADADAGAGAGAGAGADANVDNVKDGCVPSSTPVLLLHVPSFAKSRNARTISATMASCEG